MASYRNIVAYAEADLVCLSLTSRAYAYSFSSISPNTFCNSAANAVYRLNMVLVKSSRLSALLSLGLAKKSFRVDSNYRRARSSSLEAIKTTFDFSLPNFSR